MRACIEEILRHRAEDESNKIIARCLDICDGTVTLHVKAILHKLEFALRVEVAVFAAQRNLGGKLSPQVCRAFDGQFVCCRARGTRTHRHSNRSGHG